MGAPGPAIWTAPRDAKLRELYAQPLNKEEIAERMADAEWKPSRNAIASRVKDLKLYRDPAMISDLRKKGAKLRARGDWTPEREAELVRMFGIGMSGAQIAKALGGLSRSAVGAKLHRLGLCASSEGVREAKRIVGRQRMAKTVAKTPAPRINVSANLRNAYETQPDQPLPTFEPEVVDVSTTKTLVDLGRRDCRWIIGEASADSLYCGKPVSFKEGEPRPYCAAHAARAFVAPAKLTRVAPDRRPATIHPRYSSRDAA